MFAWSKSKTKRGFTIVELVIVIGVIAILAAIGIVGYNGVTNHAREVGLKSDLDSTASKLALYYKNNGAYPSSLSSDLKAESSSTHLTYQTTDTGYCLQATNTTDSDQNYHVTEAGQIESGKCAAVIISIDGGYSHTCIGVTSDEIYCWGWNIYGQLGDGTTTGSSSPVVVARGAIPNNTTIEDIVVDSYRNCVVTSNNKAYCWGDNSDGRLGDGTSANRYTPVAVSQGAIPGGVTIKSITLGSGHTCAIGSDNKAYCWGYNSDGQLGDGTTTSRSTPVAVAQGAIPGGVTIKSIAPGGNHTCAIGSDNKAYCWGWNTNGQLGDGTTTSRSTPVAVAQGAIPGGVTISSIVSGWTNTCVIGSDNKAYCWGPGGNGQLGDGTGNSSVAPVAVAQGAIPGGVTIKSMSLAHYYTCAIGSDNKAYCWGYNNSGQLGDGTTTQRYTPVAVSQGDVPNGLTIKSLFTSYAHTCALASDNKTYCWGSNSHGELGDGTTTQRTTPVATLSF